MQTIVEFKSVSKSFDGTRLMDQVSFTLNKGEITMLVGQNGAGKTTLIKFILGLERYDSGEVIVQKNIKIGYVPQKLDFNFSMPLTSKGLVATLATNGLDKSVFDYSEFIDFDLIKNRDISRISGGQLQKLMLIGTMMNKPDLLILDEPTQFLDLSSQQNFYRIISGLKHNFGTTILMISHDLFTVMRNSDQVICLNGHVCCSGKPADVDSNLNFKNALSEIGLYIHQHDHDHKH